MKELHPETIAIRTQTEKTSQMEHSVPLFLTSSFSFDDAESMRATFADEREANIYSRFSNPNASEFAEKVRLLEGAEAGFATASGMAAVYSVFAALCKQGDEIISAKQVFGSTHTLFTKYLPKFGIKVKYVDGTNPDSWQKAVSKNSKLFFLETPTNPGIEIADLEKASLFAKKNNLILVVDNCFATPFGQRPHDFGADISLHSATKFMDGQGRVLGGVVTGNKNLIHEIYLFCRCTGPAISPFNAWILSKSLETLSVRMEKHADNALKLASYFEKHEKIKWLRYPFLPSHPQYDLAKKQMKNGGGLFCFELKGGVEAGRKLIDQLKICSITANLGDTRTIVTHPASTTHARMSEEERMNAGVTPGMIRVSVGLEHWEDIKWDLENSL
jgi:O-succinylhomoserine sulfhydrylase